MRKILLLVLFGIIGLLVLGLIPMRTDILRSAQQRLTPPASSGSPQPASTDKYLTTYSEGSCQTDRDCTWAGDGCGGGHGVCTNQPKKYENMASTCDINNNFPSNRGYSCGCIKALQKCGWQR